MEKQELKLSRSYQIAVYKQFVPTIRFRYTYIQEKTRLTFQNYVLWENSMYHIPYTIIHLFIPIKQFK